MPCSAKSLDPASYATALQRRELVWYSGNAMLHNARVVGMADVNHAAESVSTPGARRVKEVYSGYQG